MRRPGVAAQEPAADALDAAQRLDAVADVHAHLGLLVHQRDRALAIAAVQLLEEVFHRLDSTHGRSVPSGDHGRREPTGRPSTDAWPLFGLRIRSERLVLRLPTDDDLLRDDRRSPRPGIHPPDEMPFGVAWSTAPSPEFERGFLQHHWGARSTWRPDDWALNLMVELDGRADRVAVHPGRAVRDLSDGPYRLVAGAAFQGRGFGKEMRAAVLAFAFDGLGARVAETEAFPDNAASNGVSRSLGYEENGFGASPPEGTSRADAAVPHDAAGGGRGLGRRSTIEGLDGAVAARPCLGRA